ncbi:MAG: class I SAM-dependent methyltransferase [Cyanobacteria bacterium J06621_8]
MSQTWNAQQYINHASFVAEYGLPVLDLLNPQPGERILDLGCGDGALTSRIKSSGAEIYGVDSSASMIKTAQTRGLAAEVMNGEDLQFNNEFDAVFSNAALHWMTNIDHVLAGVFKSLKANGRFVGEFGGEGNIAALLRGMETVFALHPEFGKFKSPWYFPGVNQYQQKLQNMGFKVHYIELIPRPTPLKSGVREWLKLFAVGITNQLNREQQDTFLSEVENLVRPDLLIEGQWVADYVRLRFAAQKT